MCTPVHWWTKAPDSLKEISPCAVTARTAVLWWWSSSLCLPARSRVWLFVTPWTVAHQAPLSVGFSTQEYCCGLPCPPPGDLSCSGIEPASCTSKQLLCHLAQWTLDFLELSLSSHSEHRTFWTYKIMTLYWSEPLNLWYFITAKIGNNVSLLAHFSRL